MTKVKWNREEKNDNKLKTLISKRTGNTQKPSRERKKKKLQKRKKIEEEEARKSCYKGKSPLYSLHFTALNIFFLTKGRSLGAENNRVRKGSQKKKGRKEREKFPSPAKERVRVSERIKGRIICIYALMETGSGRRRNTGRKVSPKK